MTGNTLDEDVQVLERKAKGLERKVRILRAHLQQTRGLAHDINSLVSAIIGYNGLLKSLMQGENGKKGEFLDEVNKAALRLNKALEAIHTLSRAEDYNLHSLDLNKVVYGFLNEPEYLWIKENNPAIEFAVKYHPAPLYFKGSEEHIERILSNLLRNAVEAADTRKSNDKKSISIETAVERSKDPHYQDAEPQEYALLSVADNGCGISPENLARMFKTSFSTKNADHSHRRGCGLSVIEGIVREHKGHVKVYSEVGTGTQFKIYIPRLTDLAVAEEAAKQ